MVIPCGYCQGCRLGKARDWSTRMACEAQMHEVNSFLTMSYSDEHLPEDYGLHIRHLQLFMKKLRRHLYPGKVRYYACGEYGETTLRPHYHVCLFGFAFPDKIHIKNTSSGLPLYRSDLLDSLWTDDDGTPRGFCWIGAFTAQSAGYVARYTMKKISGPPAGDHYQRIHPVTGEINHVAPEFACMSKRPGIGGAWFDKYESDCFPSDFLVIDAEKVPVPKAFSRKLKARSTTGPDALVSKTELSVVSEARKRRAAEPHQVWNNSKERLAIREEVTASRVTRLKRDFE